MTRRSLNPFRDLIDWINRNRNRPTIPTATEPARIRTTRPDKPYFNLADPHGTIDELLNTVRRTRP